MRLTTTVHGSTASLAASVTSTLACGQLEPKALEARRSGSAIEVVSSRALSILSLALLSTILLVVRQERQAGGPTWA